MSIRRDEDFAILQATCDRIYPKDDSGPRTVELNIVYFIDNQLATAGGGGYNSREYMRGPSIDGTPEQGRTSQPYV